MRINKIYIESTLPLLQMKTTVEKHGKLIFVHFLFYFFILIFYFKGEYVNVVAEEKKNLLDRKI